MWSPDKITCDVCERNLISSNDVEAPSLLIKVQGSISSLAEIYPELNQGDVFAICLVCHLKSLGVRVPVVK